MSPVAKRPKEKFTIPSRYILMLLTAISIGLMVLTFFADFKPTALNNIVGVTVAPMQSGLSRFSSFANEKVSEWMHLRSVMKENEELKKQVEELTKENVNLQQERYELENLRALFELSETYSDYEMTAARVIAKDSGNWYASFVIDKGTKDGMEIDMNVLSEAGLVGRITAVGYNWSKVTGIIEDTSNVSASVISTGDNLIVSGNLLAFSEGRIEFSQLHDKGNLVTPGDKVVTSNISDKYLPGILIGYITEITADSNNLTKSGTLVPYTDFEHLSNVLVITTQKQTVK